VNDAVRNSRHRLTLYLNGDWTPYMQNDPMTNSVFGPPDGNGGCWRVGLFNHDINVLLYATADAATTSPAPEARRREG
jgi:hypothetical protein